MAFDPTCAYRLSDEVALRQEPFGALAYHFGNRRLTFLTSPLLVGLVRALGEHRNAHAAVAALVPAAERDRYARALGRLADSQVIHER